MCSQLRTVLERLVSSILREATFTLGNLFAFKEISQRRVWAIECCVVGEAGCFWTYCVESHAGLTPRCHFS
jgi:hypothetical protein